MGQQTVTGSDPSIQPQIQNFAPSGNQFLSNDFRGRQNIPSAAFPGVDTSGLAARKQGGLAASQPVNTAQLGALAAAAAAGGENAQIFEFAK